ncbi:MULTISPECIES: BrnA antitoxin family protein [unclassified Methylobacterium]|uniref:BrnA antitoxin family protein n=1 Tax=unclassified Methylobacterium TaxID=2615210 RepID=UPI001FBADC75|nr:MULTISPECIES: BrnA antitoxin family protein [unclassified Methylobacterium]MCJ2020862.1 BrnA antitoxin family protein [Methylobacterium sp. E-065]
MAEDRNRRRFTDPRAAAEAAFRAATSPKPEAPAPQQAAPRTVTPPGTREVVSLRLDSTVLAHFQKDGPGWQDRINAALKALIPAGQD